MKKTILIFLVFASALAFSSCALFESAVKNVKVEQSFSKCDSTRIFGDTSIVLPAIPKIPLVDHSYISWNETMHCFYLHICFTAKVVINTADENTPSVVQQITTLLDRIWNILKIIYQFKI